MAVLNAQKVLVPGYSNVRDETEWNRCQLFMFDIPGLPSPFSRPAEMSRWVSSFCCRHQSFNLEEGLCHVISENSNSPLKNDTTNVGTFISIIGCQARFSYTLVVRLHRSSTSDIFN